MKLLPAVQRLIRQTNIFFIRVILTVFYCTILGIIALLYQVTRRPKQNKESYWLDATGQPPDFDSAY